MIRRFQLAQMTTHFWAEGTIWHVWGERSEGVRGGKLVASSGWRKGSMKKGVGVRSDGPRLWSALIYQVKELVHFSGIEWVAIEAFCTGEQHLGPVTRVECGGRRAAVMGWMRGNAGQKQGREKVGVSAKNYYLFCLKPKVFLRFLSNWKCSFPSFLLNFSY